MAKEPGFPYTIKVDDAGAEARTVSNDVTNFDFSTPYGVQDITGVDKSGTERQLLLADFSSTLNGVPNFAANMSHAVFSGDLRVPRTLDLELSNQQLAPEVLFTDYRITRPANAGATWAAPAVLQDGTVPTWVDTTP